MLRAIFFDWNGTLLDDLETVFQSVLDIFQHYHVSPPTLEDYRREITSNFIKFYLNHGIPPTATPEGLNEIRVKSLQAAGTGNLHLTEGISEVLLYLSEHSRLHLGIVSSGNSELVPRQIEHLGINSFFALVITGAYGDGKKAEALRQALNQFGLQSREAMYVDDTQDGIEAAKEVGLWTVGAGWKTAYHDRERIALAKPNFLISEPRELIATAEDLSQVS